MVKRSPGPRTGCVSRCWPWKILLKKSSRCAPSTPDLSRYGGFSVKPHEQWIKSTNPLKVYGLVFVSLRNLIHKCKFWATGLSKNSRKLHWIRLLIRRVPSRIPTSPQVAIWESPISGYLRSKFLNFHDAKFSKNEDRQWRFQWEHFGTSCHHTRGEPDCPDGWDSVFCWEGSEAVLSTASEASQPTQPSRGR